MNQATSLVELDNDITLSVKDPDGNLLQAGDPGVAYTETSAGASFLIDVAEVYTPKPGETSATWEIIVQGSGDHVLNAAAESDLHLEYLSSYFLGANKEQILRARLKSEPGSPGVDNSSVQFALKHVTNGKVQLIDLYDDGQHNDGQAGDGIFAGRVVPKRGLWYLAARGELANGASFQRMDGVPIRVKGFKTSKPVDNQQVAGNSSTIAFQVTNEVGEGLNQASSKMYELNAASLLGWANVEDVPGSLVLAPGETATIQVKVNVPADAEAGAVEETFLTVVEAEDIGSSETLTVKTTVVDEMMVYLPSSMKP